MAKNQWIEIGIILFTISILGINLAILPYLSRRGVIFGVAIPNDKRKDPLIKKIINQYIKFISIGTLVCVLISVASHRMLQINDYQWVLIFNGLIILMITIYFLIYVDAYKKMKQLKKDKKWFIEGKSKVVVDTNFRKGKIIVSPLWFLLYAGIIVVSLIVGAIMYKTLPGQLATQFNAAGVADAWASKDKAIYYMPMIQLVIMLVMFFAYYSIGKAKQVLNVENPKAGMKNNRAYRYAMSAFIVFLGLGLEIVFFLFHLTTLQIIQIMSLWMMILPIGITLIALGGIMMIYLKYRRNEQSGDFSKDDDQYWKLGSFYYNPNDPTIFIEKRVGIGWTCNYARSTSWIITLGIIAIPLMLIFMVQD